MDLTGENPAYKVPNLKKRVVTENQVIPLPGPVYPESLEVTIEATVTTSMIRGVDWTITESDYDYDAMGRAQLQDKNWNGRLIKSFTIIKPFIVPYTINCAYQQLYPNVPGYILSHPDANVEITPEVIYQMLMDIENLKLATAPIEDAHAAAERKPLLLPPDPTKSNKGNVIDGEVWEIDTTIGKKIIFPMAGAFYKDSIKIARGRHELVSDVAEGPDAFFKEGIDYVITGVDSYGVHNTTNPSGVYHLVIFIIPYVGDVTITYHAYGGNPTVYDVRALYESLTNVYNWVTSANVLTDKTLGTTSLMHELRARLFTLEEEMRKLSNAGKPSYGDATHGTCIAKKIISVDTEFHWWTIASLYKVSGSDTVYTADIGRFQVQSLYTKLLLDFMVAVDINKPEGQQLQVKPLISNIPEGCVMYSDDSQMDMIIRPQLRIVYNHNSVQGSGIYLQLGLRLKGVPEETLAIADMSGMESCFKLVEASEVSVYPEDDNIVLPNPDHYWSIDNPDSHQESVLYPLLDRGHVVWAGSEMLNRPSSGLKTFQLAHCLEKEIDLSRIRNIRLYLEEKNAVRFVVDMPVYGTNEAVTAVGAFSYAAKPASVVFNAVRHPATREVTMNIQSEITAGINSNELNLRYVTVNT